MYLMIFRYICVSVFGVLMCLQVDKQYQFCLHFKLFSNSEEEGGRGCLNKTNEDWRRVLFKIRGVGDCGAFSCYTLFKYGNNKKIYKLVFVGFSFMSHKPKTTTATRAPLAPNRADCSEWKEGRPTSGRPPVIFVPNTLLRFKCV